MKFFKKDNGITLIALVITIIVLLILAGVALATITGDDGVLNKATEAKGKNEEATEDELRRLTALEAATNLEETAHIDNSTGEEKIVKIPAKCAVSQVEGENTLEDGLVIIDANGNEWVWIEVPKSVTENATTNKQIENALISYVTEYRDSNYSDTWYEGCGLEEYEFYDKYNEMLESIKTNGGFYIGRYEVGIKEDIYRNFGKEFEIEHPVNETPVIQRDKYVYNWVTCNQAEELAEGLATEGKTSSLMFGIQWDLILKYLEVNGNWDTTTNEVSYYLKTNSGSWGNYSNETFDITRGKYSTDNGSSYTEVNGSYTKPASTVLLTTGTTERNSKMNIYDLAGNINERTLEKSNNETYPSSYRAGDYNDISEERPVLYRDYTIYNCSYYDLGFRPALY